MDMLLDYLTSVGEIFVVPDSTEGVGPCRQFCVLDFEWIFRDVIGAILPVHPSSSSESSEALRDRDGYGFSSLFVISVMIARAGKA